MDLPDSYDYEGFKRLSYKLNRPATTLIALSSSNDPFYIGPSRQADAEWFARLWKRFNIGHGVHLRRLHYLFMSQRRPLPMPDGNAIRK
jgi:hypothetical protein